LFREIDFLFTERPERTLGKKLQRGRSGLPAFDPNEAIRGLSIEVLARPSHSDWRPRLSARE
jgi:hypothetical protein